MITNKTLYALQDITVVPAEISTIRHRNECNVYYEMDNRKMLPIFTSPMDTVVSPKNFQQFIDNKITPILPRTESLEKRLEYVKNGLWSAFGLHEFQVYFCNGKWNEKQDSPVYTSKYYEFENLNKSQQINVLIDMANGHILDLFSAIRNAKKTAKELGYNLVVMAGNIANPHTFIHLADAGADYIRVNVGGGSRCFVDGTKITMADGTKKNIEDLVIGDSVKTKNNDEKITNVIRFYTTDELITINDIITCTADHQFYVINKTDKDVVNENNIEKYAYWIEANKLDKNKHLLIKKS